MNYEFLSRLYYACTDENEMLGAGLNLSELYEQLGEVETAEQAFNEKLERLPVSEQEQEEVYDLQVELYRAYEKQGFINGFRIAMMMGQELLRKEAQTV